MNRRSFLSGLSALIGGIALEKAVPLGRVWSFPSEIKCLNVEAYSSASLPHLAAIYYDKAALRMLEEHFSFANLAEFKPLPQASGKYIRLNAQESWA